MVLKATRATKETTAVLASLVFKAFLENKAVPVNLVR